MWALLLEVVHVVWIVGEHCLLGGGCSLVCCVLVAAVYIHWLLGMLQG